MDLREFFPLNCLCFLIFFSIMLMILVQKLPQVLFQYAARHAPMNISDIIAAVSAPDDDDDKHEFSKGEDYILWYGI